ncbi:diacylglycerol O-acyltransferase 2-like [Bufo gargarizans]|uniref:diacylglycerol O-acyltransferase 2-like n=1 Tax=Bufo gargarizans TaxID=30331 RepID=UPI001CF307A5|nr:diacylglycerol O-acyltransferase 2-like [Bufo gargarizans]
MKTLNTPSSGLLQGTGSSLLSTVQDLPSVPRPSRSRVKRQLQIISVLQWVITVSVGGVACTAILLYLFCTDWWLIAALYLAWLVFDRKTPSEGGRRSTWFRNCAVWRYFRDHFPIRLVKTHNLLPSCNYIFGYHPHGVLALGVFCNFGTEATGFSKKFPGIKPSVTTLDGTFRMPVVREYLMSAGHCSVSRQSIDYILSKKGTGNAVVIVIGGIAECLDCIPGKNSVILKQRKGFVKAALQHGANLVPVYSFGEDKVYKRLVFEEHSWGRRLKGRFRKLIGLLECLFYGCGFFSADSWGFVPYPIPITTVVGEPIAVPKMEQPTQKDVDLYHSMYVTSLQKLFDKYKTEFGLSESDVLEIM